MRAELSVFVRSITLAVTKRPALRETPHSSLRARGTRFAYLFRMTVVGASSLLAAFAAGTGKTVWDVASRGLSFAMSVLVARELGASGYGTFAVYWYAAWMLSQATDLGLHLVSLRSLAMGQNPSVFWSAVAAKGLLTTGVIVAVAAAVAAGSFSPNLLLVFVLLGAHLMASWVEFFGVVLRSKGFMAREGLLLMALRLGWLVAAFWVLTRNASLAALAGALVLASVPALGAATVLVRRTVPVRGSSAAQSETVRLFKESFPLAIGAVMTLVYLRADLFILAILSDANETGLFQSAFRLFEATFVLSGGIAAGTFPILASRIGTPRFDVLSRFLLFLLASAGGVLAFVFVLAGEPMSRFYMTLQLLPSCHTWKKRLLTRSLAPRDREACTIRHHTLRVCPA